MMKKLIIPLVVVLAAACAQDNSPSTGDRAKEYLSLWIDKYHKGVTPNADGLYILEESIDPTKPEVDKPYVFAEVTIRTLSGTVSATDDRALAKQLYSDYKDSDYYGPRLVITGEYYTYAGFDALLKGMHIGDTRRAILPAWMITTSRYGSQQEYLDACTSSTHLDYTVKVTDQTDDVVKWEKTALADYVKAKYGALVESVAVNEDSQADSTFWFILLDNPEGTETLEDNTSVKINYTGRLLNGQIFDTTVEDDAVLGGIFDSSKTYSTVQLTYSTNSDEVYLGGSSSSSLISGFRYGITHMDHVGQKAAVLFYSSFGYSSSGSGSSIPPYAPLEFEIEIASL